jgi:membrane fusion protein (multidrug efflux system)
MLIFVGVVLGGIHAFKTFQNAMISQYMGQMSQQPQTVSTAIADYQEWHNTIFAIGGLRAVRGVDVSTEVAGIVENIYFESGYNVANGDLLVKLRADDEIAVLDALKADEHLANLTYQRDIIQLQRSAIPQSTVDLDIATLDKARAGIAEQEAIIAKKFIRAPFAGRLGLRLIDLGEYLSPGNIIVTLQALDPIYFDFYLPEQDLAHIKIGQTVSVKSDVYPDKTFPGKIWAMNSKVDAASRNMQIRAELDNSELKLLPGMYGVITIDIGSEQKLITLPQTAIIYNPYGNTVYTVKKKGKDSKGKDLYVAEQKFVTVGEARGDQISVLSGIQPGDEVVTAGQIKLQNGSSILINNAVQPSNDVNPTPKEY